MNITETFEQSLPRLKKILVVGNGGRENSLAWALQKSTGVEAVFVAPGNGGTAFHSGCTQLHIKETDVEQLIKTSLDKDIDLIVIGPEAPLAAGLADKLRAAGLSVFGPNANGALLEASKEWAKELMSKAGVPTAHHWTITSIESGIKVLNKVQKPLVVKADGLAAGKGVTVPETLEETKKAIQEAFDGKFGIAGETVVLEERLNGPEVSVFALCDGERFVLLPTAQDHKRLKEGDKGPNTGGMGAYAPAPLLSKKDLVDIQRSILNPTLKELNKRGINYRGVIYAGLMITNTGAKVIEFNCRFGDPECQTLMPLLGPELARVLQACAIGRLDIAPSLSIKNSCSACVVAASSGYPESPRKGDQLFINLEFKKSLQLFHAGTKKNIKGQLVTDGGRVLAVVAQGKSFDDAFELAYKGMNMVDFEGIRYRQDIGNQVRKVNP